MTRLSTICFKWDYALRVYYTVGLLPSIVHRIFCASHMLQPVQLSTFFVLTKVLLMCFFQSCSPWRNQAIEQKLETRPFLKNQSNVKLTVRKNTKSFFSNGSMNGGHFQTNFSYIILYSNHQYLLHSEFFTFFINIKLQRFHSQSLKSTQIFLIFFFKVGKSIANIMKPESIYANALVFPL